MNSQELTTLGTLLSEIEKNYQNYIESTLNSFIIIDCVCENADQVSLNVVLHWQIDTTSLFCKRQSSYLVLIIAHNPYSIKSSCRFVNHHLPRITLKSRHKRKNLLLFPSNKTRLNKQTIHSFSFSTSLIMTVAINKAEQQYLDLCQKIIDEGEHRPDRTGTGTKSLFAPPQLRFDLSNDSFPLLTTKRVFSKGIIHELLWFIAGSTDAKILSEKGVKIWEGNGLREFLDNLGLTHRREGDLGPVYGFQWRHFGAKYQDCDTDYTGQGFDQLQDVIKKLKTNPYDRRIIMSAWNPPDFPLMALPPCHVFCQFYVSFPNEQQAPDANTTKQAKLSSRPKLSCLLYQRSCDMGLGVPFNIASYALLTKMIAHVVDMDCGEFIHTLGDAHVYLDHIDALKEQMERTPKQFPKLIIKKERKEEIKSIDDFKFEDFDIVGYEPYPAIKMKMSV